MSYYTPLADLLTGSVGALARVRAFVSDLALFLQGQSPGKYLLGLRTVPTLSLSHFLRKTMHGWNSTTYLLRA